MWPFTKRKPKVKYEFCDTWGSQNTRIKILVDGEELINEMIAMWVIPQHAQKVRDYEAKLKAMQMLLDASIKQSVSIWYVLGCMPTTDRSVVEKAYRKMAMIYHPDHGGDSKAFQTLFAAKAKALAKCK